MKYLVRWEIDSDAATPLEAAREARAAQLEPGTTATIFDVFPVHPAGCLGISTRIDLEELTHKEEDERQFLNHYRCAHIGTPDEGLMRVSEWTDEWSCACNDRCPLCNAEVEPYHSDDLTAEKPFTCRGCGRVESVCSANPCTGVVADREATL